MNRLLQIELTEADKDYLREKARNGVCSSVNDHECYLGMNFNSYFAISKPFLRRIDFLLQLGIFENNEFKVET